MMTFDEWWDKCVPPDRPNRPKKIARAAWGAALENAVPAEAALPNEPTDAMLSAIINAFSESDFRDDQQMTQDKDIARDAYRRLLAVSPRGTP